MGSWLEGLEKETTNVNQRLREITQGLHPTVLTNLGLISAIQAYLDTIVRQPLSASAPRVITLTAQGFSADRIPDLRLERDLYHITRQALDNAVAHAQADQVFIHVRWSSDAVSVTVQDTGRGMQDTPERLMGQRGHLGLLSMNERVRAWGGRLTLELSRRTRDDGARLDSGQTAQPLARPSAGHHTSPVPPGARVKISLDQVDFPGGQDKAPPHNDLAMISPGDRETRDGWSRSRRSGHGSTERILQQHGAITMQDQTIGTNESGIGERHCRH